MTAWTRFWDKVDVGDCWNWTASTTHSGYGQFFPAPSKRVRAHRWAWEELVGPIGEGMELDHLCLNKRCVNPDHLEAVTKAENLARRFIVSGGSCKRGHGFTADNTRTDPRTSRRKCRICERARDRKYKYDKYHREGGRPMSKADEKETS